MLTFSGTSGFQSDALKSLLEEHIRNPESLRQSREKRYQARRKFAKAIIEHYDNLELFDKDLHDALATYYLFIEDTRPIQKITRKLTEQYQWSYVVQYITLAADLHDAFGMPDYQKLSVVHELAIPGPITYATGKKTTTPWPLPMREHRWA